MSLNYKQIAEEYKPHKIKTLLIGEAPPPDGESYIYIPHVPVPETSLPSTVFQHYFGKKPSTIEEYKAYLEKLCEHEIFVMDICDLPLRIRNDNFPDRVDPQQLAVLISHIPLLYQKIISRGINIPGEQIIFLMARNRYYRQIRENFPKSKAFLWRDFRRSREMLLKKFK